MSAPGRPHLPVLLAEVVRELKIEEGDRIVDGTFGAGGYTKAILEAGAGEVIGFDRDPDAIAAARERVPDERLTLVAATFSQMGEQVEGQVDGVVLDLGVSSMQLDQAERGFAFKQDGPLDMRMSQEGMSAAEFVNTAPEAELARVIKLYGEEPRARRVAAAIVKARPLSRTGELADVVRKTLGYHKGMKTDPATRTFQGIRIHLNAELEELEKGLVAAEKILKPGGRLAVVSFHSLEDRIVKKFLRERSGNRPQGSRHLPQVEAGPPATFEEVSKAIAPSETEMLENPRARSSKLRAATRTDAPAWGAAA
ncbi:16S rRNA (cytosine(1402)-N(4))-methyltransferase RsmH [Sphingomicrobium aestuariivivum]|uniref:16S rRNA (cytosine(1402)-N(4))-methyltransferase RsmH n=1 Tax=Sphingomicrobium aestuariivivum TaxID=1582356 RepID=UPI001FD6B8FD|nr:16S rRNA (cytosine(1402)-N(4))-methyltransferase RsmH [Sphingomicrobium aestuariivivum]MCJ8190663.1 16S rRNA (cytosine(1402)-N(4))-methyltransferase RsmH [Sphingomicrobium aestuariivivum]